MPQTINRGTCISSGCLKSAFFKRLCKPHLAEKYPDLIVRDYQFTWNIIESFEGVIRATSQEEALKLVKSGVAAGTRRVIGPKPVNIELTDTKEC